MNTQLQNTIRYGSYAAIVLIILTLTGMFTAFQGSPVVIDVINLGNVMFSVSLFGIGYLVASQLETQAPLPRALHGLIASGIVGIALSVLTVFQTNVDMQFVFRNLEDLVGSALVFGQEELVPGLTIMIGAGLGLGALGAVMTIAPPETRNKVFLTLGIITIVGLLQERLVAIIDLPDVLALILPIIVAYAIAYAAPLPNLYARIATGLLVGLAFGIILMFGVRGGGLEDGGWLRGIGSDPVVLALALEERGDDWIFFLGLLSISGGIGALVTSAERQLHNAAWYLITGLLILALLNWQDSMTLLLAVMSFVILMGIMLILPHLSTRADARFNGIGEPPDDDIKIDVGLPRIVSAMSSRDQTVTRLLFYAATVGVLVITPVFVGQYITSVLDLVMLYIIMGIGLNVMIGYAGLLDLGYVASYAIGAYTAGLLTTPSLITLGCTNPEAAEMDYFEMCTGVLTDWAGTGIFTFWESWPLAILFSALTGMMLGVPVLRLRGDYLAIVTLGFGEIVNRLLLSNTFRPLLGGAQGISPIPSPVIDLTGIGFDYTYTLSNARDNYYLFLVGVAIAAFVVLRLANSRLGRAWRAIRADEDVAEAIGIHLVGTKLLAFGISSAFAGLGGAIFGGWLQGIFPNSFTIFVSINVLSLIIIGGMGSIPGVMLGAFMLIGLPEALREIQDYRLLAFGSLLVVAMLLKPEGLLPPRPPQLTKRATTRAKETVTS